MTVSEWMAEHKIAERSLPEKLRYLSGQLLSQQGISTTTTAVGITLDVIAADLTAQAAKASEEDIAEYRRLKERLGLGEWQ
jgi:hypothetical protein